MTHRATATARETQRDWCWLALRWAQLKACSIGCERVRGPHPCTGQQGCTIEGSQDVDLRVCLDRKLTRQAAGLCSCGNRAKLMWEAFVCGLSSHPQVSSCTSQQDACPASRLPSSLLTQAQVGHDCPPCLAGTKVCRRHAVQSESHAPAGGGPAGGHWRLRPALGGASWRGGLAHKAVPRRAPGQARSFQSLKVSSRYDVH